MPRPRRDPGQLSNLGRKRAWASPSGTSTVLGDLDLDGGLDVLLTQSNGPARLFRNEAPRRGSWLVLRAFDPELGRDAVGARVDVETGGLTRRAVVTSTCSYLAAVEPLVHFGLGGAAVVDRVTIQWPDGVRQRLLGLPADRRVVVYKPRTPHHEEIDPRCRVRSRGSRPWRGPGRAS